MLLKTAAPTQSSVSVVVVMTRHHWGMEQQEQ
jgi:hypothetical protein